LSFVVRLLINPIVGSVIAPALGKRLWERWRHLSYAVPLLMQVPVIALDEPAPRDAFGRADSLVRSRWGEHARPAHSVAALAPLLLVPATVLLGTPMIRHGLVAHDPGWVRAGLAATLIAMSTYIELSALTNALFALAAYRFATGGRADVFPGDSSYAEHAFATPAAGVSGARR
jgi:hypothetical protein